MAVGDRLQAGDDVIANNGTVDFKAAASGEALLQALVIQAGKAVEVYFTNDSGTTVIKTDDVSGGTIAWGVRVSDTNYIQLKNVSGGNAGVWATGVVTK